MGLNVLIIKLGTFGMAVHENVQSICMNDSGTRYIIVERDGTQISVSKDGYMLTILR